MLLGTMSVSSTMFIAMVLLLVYGVGGTDHIVGANRGWNPGFNYTLWSNNQTFYVGDLISFRYQKNQYNVFEVNQTGYDNCTTEGAVGNWSKGKDFILLNMAKRYYFIRYQKNQYNVFEVNQTGYDNCTTEGAVGNWSKGKDFILLNMAKRYYFICGNGQCFNGMKVSVLVHPLPSPPTSPQSSANHSSHNSAAPLPFELQLRSLVFSSALLWFGWN